MKNSLDILMTIAFLPKPLLEAQEINQYYENNKAIIDDFLDALANEYGVLQSQIVGFDALRLAELLIEEFSRYPEHPGMRKLAELETIYNYLADNNYGECSSSLYQVHEAINTTVMNQIEAKLANDLKPGINEYKEYLLTKAKKEEYQITTTKKYENLTNRINAINNLSKKIETGSVSLEEAKTCVETCLKNNYNLASEKTFFDKIVNLVPVLFKALYTTIKPSNEKSFQAALKQTLGEIKNDSDVSPPEPDEGSNLKI